MRLTAILIGSAVLAAVSGALAQTAPQQPSDVFTGIVGSCWRTQMDNKGPDTDTHCFEAAVGGKMVTDTHKVRNPKGEIVYEGVSVYLLDKPSGTLKYEYFYSNGGKLIGYGWRVGDEIRFGSQPGQAKPDIVWKLSGDKYTATASSAELGHSGTFVKLKPGR